MLVLVLVRGPDPAGAYAHVLQEVGRKGGQQHDRADLAEAAHEELVDATQASRVRVAQNRMTTCAPASIQASGLEPTSIVLPPPLSSTLPFRLR